VLLRAFSIAAVLPGQPLMPLHIDELTCVCWHTGRTWSTCKAEPWLHPPTKTPSSYLQGWPICYNVICCNVVRCIVGCCIVVLQRRTTLRVVRQAVAGCCVED
jgi:hypothetical protein